ncbi:MAG: hypothetical protein WC220_12130, partial [Pedobacter sp.]
MANRKKRMRAVNQKVREKPSAPPGVPKSKWLTPSRYKIIGVAAILAVLIIAWSQHSFDSSNVQIFTNISVVVLASIASLSDLRNDQRKITIWGWIFTVLSVVTILGYISQGQEKQKNEVQKVMKSPLETNRIPGKIDTNYRDRKQITKQPQKPILEVLGVPQITRKESTLTIITAIAVVDDIPANIVTASTIMFTTEMIEKQQKPKGNWNHALENTIVSRSLPLSYTQNANVTGTIPDTIYSYLKIEFTTRNRDSAKMHFKR